MIPDGAIEVDLSGFVRLVDSMGDDTAIVDAARISYKKSKPIRSDTGLIRYLMRHSHWTPFEMCELKFQIKAPIFVARQWMRHRDSYNEVSGRYSELKPEFFLPFPEDLAKQSIKNKQGREEPLSPEVSAIILRALENAYQNDYQLYQELLGEGLAKELARISLPAGTYTEFYWKANLRKVFSFLGLRLDTHAQLEIRRYAQAVAQITEKLYPVAYQAFTDFQLNAVTFSGPEMQILKELLGATSRSVVTDLAGSELVEFKEKLGWSN